MNSKKLTTRDRILEGATRVFAERGFASTTIAEIARVAHVSEASVYDHFNAKEELFHAIPAERIKETLPVVEDQLFGVKGALNQLRKLVWAYIGNLMEHRTFAQFVFLHLKPSKTFKDTEGHKEVMKFYGKITETIGSGQKSGEISAHISPDSARMLIIGSVDYVLMRWLLKDCSYNVIPQIEEIYDLIEHALRPAPSIQVQIAYEGQTKATVKLSRGNGKRTVEIAGVTGSERRKTPKRKGPGKER